MNKISFSTALCPTHSGKDAGEIDVRLVDKPFRTIALSPFFQDRIWSVSDWSRMMDNPNPKRFPVLFPKIVGHKNGKQPNVLS